MIVFKICNNGDINRNSFFVVEIDFNNNCNVVVDYFLKDVFVMIR